MPETITSLSQGINNTWAKLGKTQKIIVSASFVMVFVILIIIAFNASKGPNYGVLWSNLDPLDGGAIIGELDKQGVPYKLTNGGTTITIPANMVHETRLSLASQGLPSSGVVGFESIASNGIWATDFDRQVQYLRALSGELTRTIKSISGVDDARVHIVLPEPSVFVSQRQPATAAVLVQTKPMHELNSGTVKAIINLVARSVQNLSSQDVTVVDSSGRLLSQDYALLSGAEGASELAYELTTKVEQELERRLINLLGPVLGPGNIVCQVRAELNMDKVTSIDTVYDNTEPQGILLGTEEIRETYHGTGTPPGGVAGGLDVPTYGSTSETETEWERIESRRNYEVNQSITETIINPGSVKRLSVAVVVNGDIDEEVRTLVGDTVSAALGLDPARQDMISVTGIPFDTTLAHQIQEAFADVPQGLPPLYLYSAVAAGVLVIGAIVLLLLKRRNKKVEEDIEEFLPEPVLQEAPTVSPEIMERQKLKEAADKLARTNPEAVASLVKTWLLEDER